MSRTRYKSSHTNYKHFSDASLVLGASSLDAWQQLDDSEHAGRAMARKFHSEKRRPSDRSVGASSQRDVILARSSSADSSTVGPALTLELIKEHSKSTLLDGVKPQNEVKRKKRKSEDIQKMGKMSELQKQRCVLFFFAS